MKNLLTLLLILCFPTLTLKAYIEQIRILDGVAYPVNGYSVGDGSPKAIIDTRHPICQVPYELGYNSNAYDQAGITFAALKIMGEGTGYIILKEKYQDLNWFPFPHGSDSRVQTNYHFTGSRWETVPNSEVPNTPYIYFLSENKLLGMWVAYLFAICLPCLLTFLWMEIRSAGDPIRKEFIDRADDLTYIDSWVSYGIWQTGYFIFSILITGWAIGGKNYFVPPLYGFACWGLFMLIIFLSARNMKRVATT